MLFFDRKPASADPWTRTLWIYDLRTNKNFTLKTNRLERADLDELVACYREHNEPLHAELAECAGMTGVLTALKDEGRRLGVVTAKRRETVQLAFSYLPLERFFDVVVGSDDTERHKPDPAPLEHALGLLDASPAEAVYVGDSPFDIRAAKGAGMHSVAVTWGGIHPRARLEAEEPDAVVESAEELLAAL